MQHSAMNWQVKGRSFERREHVSEASARLVKTFDRLLIDHDATWRERFTNAVFDSLAAGGSTMDELAAGAPASLVRVARAYLGVDPELQQAVQDVVAAFVSESISQQLSDAGMLGGAIASLFAGKRSEPQEGGEA